MWDGARWDPAGFLKENMVVTRERGVPSSAEAFMRPDEFQT
jgi:hypothetical protein